MSQSNNPSTLNKSFYYYIISFARYERLQLSEILEDGTFYDGTCSITPKSYNSIAKLRNITFIP